MDVRSFTVGLVAENCYFASPGGSSQAIVVDPGEEEDRLLAVWLSHCVPTRDIAAWLGLGDRAAAKRIERLRERLQLVALRRLEASEGDDRRELLAFLGRASLAPAPAARFRAARAADPSVDAEEAPVS